MISRKVREQAITICALGASNGGHEGYDHWAKQLGIEGRLIFPDDSWCNATGADHPAIDLAIKAWQVAIALQPTARPFIQDAEAEALLRTGWSP